MNQVLSALQEGTISGFIQYVELTEPTLSKTEVKEKVIHMLKIINWSPDSINEWIQWFFKD